LVHLFPGYGQTNKGKDKVPEILDPVIKAPFELRKSNSYLHIPKALRGNVNEGFFVAELLLNQKGKMESYFIAKMKYIRDQQVIGDYYRSPYDNSRVGLVDSMFLRKITPVIEKYLKKNVKVLMVKEVQPQQENTFKILIRLD
jgi:hypothetical protein